MVVQEWVEAEPPRPYAVIRTGSTLVAESQMFRTPGAKSRGNFLPLLPRSCSTC